MATTATRRVPLPDQPAPTRGANFCACLNELRDREIAARLFLSDETVNGTLKRLYGNFEAADRIQLLGQGAPARFARRISGLTLPRWRRALSAPEHNFRHHQPLRLDAMLIWFVVLYLLVSIGVGLYCRHPHP